jgi:hypothetical protein
MNPSSRMAVVQHFRLGPKDYDLPTGSKVVYEVQVRLQAEEYRGLGGFQSMGGLTVSYANKEKRKRRVQSL